MSCTPITILVAVRSVFFAASTPEFADAALTLAKIGAKLRDIPRFKQLDRLSFRQYAPLVNEGRMAGRCHRIGRLMRDEQNRKAVLALQILHECDHLLFHR